MTRTRNVILAHGAWADASAWTRVLPLLAEAGIEATAIQMPLTSLAEDVATLRRAVALVEGPMVLVGHSYGGAVITEGGGLPNVAALVYVAGFAPDAGESAGSLGAGGPATSLPDNLRPDAEGYLKLTMKGVEESFAQDLTAAEQALIFRTQGPVSGPAALGAAISTPAWRQKPSWYVRATQDHAIHPELQRTMSERMGAHVTSVAASHVAMISQPRAVADVIIQAAK